MAAHRFYYTLKPYLPRRVRMAFRQLSARRTRVKFQATWPIDPEAAKPPANWTGWPEGKKFAFLLTHDVEGPDGLEKCRKLAELDMANGFRAAFNFIPEGPYTVPPSLRSWLKDHRFEVGVHDLHHDGKLYNSREGFRRKAERINRYLRDWGATGFRSGFMLRNLEWLHDLDISYDSSTFDTDPFEPQSEGARTIFPFWIPMPPGTKSGKPGYVELPYTLPQDSTLFLVLGETTPEVWMRKLDWIARHGGMVLLNTHPDYMRFPGERSTAGTYDVRLYEQFLQYVRSRYDGTFWQPVAGEVARLTKPAFAGASSPNTTNGTSMTLPKRAKIWIDLENTPHIPFFRPIIRELEQRGYSIVLTARDAYQTCEMADKFGLTYARIGKHYGKNFFRKRLGLFARAAQLLPFLRAERPSLALNHGSRTQSLICNAFGIPTVTVMDYEYTAEAFFLRPRWEIIPKAVNADDMPHQKKGGVLQYSGIKEDVYVPDFVPDPGIISVLGLRPEDLVITVRPPASEAHYHNPESDVLFHRSMERFCRTDGARIVLLPRNKRQEAEIRTSHPSWFAGGKVIIPQQVVDGLNLLWHSDLVVSGGGTMNREAAALGLPVYSIFRGRIGAVDLQLQKEGRLVLIESEADVETKIAVVRRSRSSQANLAPRRALSEIVGHVEAILANHYPGSNSKA